MSRNVFGCIMNTGVIAAAGILFGAAVVAQAAPAIVPPPDAVTLQEKSSATPPVSVSTNVQDYSQGFRTFMSMGVPDTSKARYVKLDYYGGGFQDMTMHRLQEFQISGNAWLISENKEDRSVLVTSSGRTLELFDQKTATKKMMEEARSNAVTQTATSTKGVVKVMGGVRRNCGQAMAEAGNWTPVDLSRDLARATALLDKKIKAKSSGAREMRYDAFLQSDEPAGALFLLAATAWQNGKTQEANALVGRLFTLVGDSRKVIVGALNVVADSQLAATLDAFRKTGDWKAYQISITGLLKKYPAGWRKAGAVKLLADHLQARVAMTEAPALTGEGLSGEDLQLAADLASETNQVGSGMYMGHGGLWIFPPAKTMRGMKNESVIGRIMARGVKSIPLLIALVPDETLCPLRRADLGMSVYYSGSGNMAQKPESERALLYFNQMDRPVTRGEIARTLLAPLMKRGENSPFNEAGGSPEEVIESAKQVYALLKDLPPSALAPYFLKNGDQQQQQIAIGYMLQDDIESNAPAIEAFLLTPPAEGMEGQGRWMMGSGLAQQYVQKRGEKAAEFVEKYVAIRQKVELPAGMADNAEYEKMLKKQADNEIKALRAMVKKQDLTELVASLASAGDENDGGMAYSALGRQPAAQAVPALLAAAVKTTNVMARVRILQMLPMLRYAGMEAQMQESMANGEDQSPESMQAAMKKFSDKNKLNIATNAAEWKILLADTRGMPNGRMYSGGAYAMTVADIAASGIEALYGDTSRMESYGRRGAYLRPDVMMKYSRDRAAARLAGITEDQLPKLPDADDVTAERRKVIDAAIIKASPAALGAVLDKLTDAENLYLMAAAAENEAITKALAPMARIIESVKTAPELSAAEVDRIKKLTGTTVSTNVIAEMRELCTRQLKAGKAFVVTLSSGGLGKGLRLEVTVMDAAMQRMNGRSGYMSMLGKNAKRKGMVMGTLMNSGSYGNGMWVVDLPAPVTTGTVASVSAEDDDNLGDRLDFMERHLESQQEQFATAAETFCKADEALGQGASVTFMGMLPVEKKDKQDEGSDGEGVVDVGIE